MTTTTNITLNDRKKRLLICGVIGTLCLFIAYAVLLINPLELIKQAKLTMYPNSLLFRLWEKPPLDVYISSYVYNITNAAEFLSGADKKLKLEQVGPYVYKEILENRNSTFNENGTISYYPHRTIIPIPERSVGDPKKDVIIIPNIAFLGASSAATKLSIIAAITVSTVSRSLNIQPLLNVTAHDFMWGYEDPLVRLASNLVPNVIHFSKLGLMDRLFDDGVNVVTMNLPESVKKFRESDSEEEDIRDFSLETWNGLKGLEHWGFNSSSKSNKPCNTLRGAYDGVLFPRNISKAEVFHFYRKAFCRTLPIQFSHATKHDGLGAYVFKLADNAFESDMDDPGSNCYCLNKQCLKKGLGDITPCYYNIPIAVSLPHFYNSDPSLLEGVEGMSPDQDKHDSTILLQPDIGVPMKVDSRVQLNLMVGPIKFNAKLKGFENTVIPVFWLEIKVERLTPYLIFLLHLLFNIGPFAQLAAIYLFALGGIIIFAKGTYTYIKSTSNPSPRKPSIKYSSVFMFHPSLITENEKTAECVSSASDALLPSD